MKSVLSLKNETINSFKEGTVLDLIKEIKEVHDCMEDNCQNVVVCTPTERYVILTPQNDLDDSIVIVFKREFVIFANVTALAWFMKHTLKVSKWVVTTKILTVEVLEH